MDLSLHTIADQGNHELERVVIDAHRPCSLLTFVLFKNMCSSDGKPSNKVRYSYWLPDQDVKRGDVVVLYTRAGDPSTTVNGNGTTTYFYFMGLDEPIWNDASNCAVLARIDQLDTMAVR